MDIREHMKYVYRLLEDSFYNGDWEASFRFTFVLYLLRRDLILEQDKLINDLRKVG